MIQRTPVKGLGDAARYIREQAAVGGLKAQLFVLFVAVVIKKKFRLQSVQHIFTYQRE